MPYPLSDDLARKLGAILGRDLSCIRIHTGGEADRRTRTLGTAAFAQGADLWFSEGRFAPESEGGLELLAHEAVHVCQQVSGRLEGIDKPWEVRPVDDDLEREAATLAPAITALIRESRRLSDLEIAALRRCRSLNRRRLGAPLSTAIQRSPATCVIAARATPPVDHQPASYGPGTCHQAVVGWLLMAEGYQSPWKLMRYANSALDSRGVGNALSIWLPKHVYNTNQLLHQDSLGVAVPGDVLFTRAPGHPAAHSMIVVGKGNAGEVYIRGFNNGGTFNYQANMDLSPFGAYDDNDRDISNQHLWNQAATGFGAENAGLDLHLVRYNDAVARLRVALQHWTHSNWRVTGHGWKHTANHCALPACPNANGPV